MNHRRILTVALACIFLGLSTAAHAQKAAVSINAGELVLAGGIGAEVNYAVAQHWSADMGVRVNPWTFNRANPEKQSQYRHQTYSIGARYWPWYVYSGFWFGAKLQYQEYSRGGFGGRLASEEGDAFGLGAELGYSWMLSHRFNLNFGVGGWGGITDYTSFSCTHCGRILESGRKFFVLPNELIIGLVFVF